MDALSLIGTCGSLRGDPGGIGERETEPAYLAIKASGAAMASASGREGQPVHRGKFVSWLSKVFEFNAAGLNWPRAVMFLDVALVPLVVFWAIGHEEYLLSALFGVLFAGLADPGGGYGYRVSRIAVFALIGAGLTALGFGIGGDAWGWCSRLSKGLEGQGGDWWHLGCIGDHGHRPANCGPPAASRAMHIPQQERHIPVTSGKMTVLRTAPGSGH